MPRKLPGADGPPSGRPPRTCRSSRIPTDPDELERLEAEAKHHRARLELYRQRSYSGKADSSRLRDLQRASDSAQARLKAARAR
jgi:hypothetical protein